jgi:hypothetical protein
MPWMTDEEMLSEELAGEFEHILDRLHSDARIPLEQIEEWVKESTFQWFMNRDAEASE